MKFKENMTVGELYKILKDIPKDFLVQLVCNCPNGCKVEICIDIPIEDPKVIRGKFNAKPSR